MSERDSFSAQPEEQIKMSERMYLSAQLKELIDGFYKVSKKHKRIHRALRYTVFAMTACSTVLASFALYFPAYQSGISLAIVFISVASGVVTSIEGLRKPGELWIHERTTHYALKDLKRELEYLEYRPADQNPPPTLDGIFTRMQSILGASGDKWNRDIASRSDPHNASGPAPPGGRPE